MIQLDERLLAAEALAGRCARAVDVGTNHGFLPVHMLQSGLCERALLCDVSADALERARKTVAKECLEERAQLAVADGLNGVELRPGDVVTLCGMGARTIAHILARNPGCPGRYYVLLRAEPGRGERMSDYEADVGPALLRDRPPLLRDYLTWRLGVTRRALDGMRVGRDAEKLRQAQNDVDDVLRALKEVDNA